MTFNEGVEMAYRVNGRMIDGRLVLDPPQYLSPEERITHLAEDREKGDLLPLSTPYWKMDFFKGIFSRQYEETQYLNRVLIKQHAAYLTKDIATGTYAANAVADLGRMDSVLGQVKLPDWATRSASISEEYENPIEAARKAALGPGLYDTDQRLASSNWVEKAAKGFPNVTVESAARDLTNSQCLNDPTIGTGLNETTEYLANAVGQQNLLKESALFKPEREMQLPSPYAFDDHLSHPVKLMHDERKRIQKEREEQRARDERDERVARNSDEALRIKKQEAQKDGWFSNPWNIVMAIISAVSAITGLIALL